MDGICNGYQHLSAMGRDPIGGSATTLYRQINPRTAPRKCQTMSAHMMLTVNRPQTEGVRHLAMVHDSFGVHAADIDLLNLPPAGNLDIRQVISSPYFFA